MLSLNETLKRYGYTKKQIDQFMFVYNDAIEKNIVYPLYYAMVKVFI